MLKRTLFIAIVILAFTFMGCHKKEQHGSPTLPSLHLTMTSMQLDSILADRDNKVSAFAVLIDANGDTLYEGDLTHIKTRGNTSFKEHKKPFTIKFPQKQKLFGLEKNRSFVLLANACDESHIRNAIGLDLARAFGIPASRYAYLTLYINGTYKGLYQMTNKVDVGKRALDITDLDDLNELANPKPLKEYTWYGDGRKKQVIQRKGVLLERDPDDITGGYLLDNTGDNTFYSKSISGFASDADDNIQIRSPKYASPQEVNYIAGLYNEMEKAVHSPDGINPETSRHYSEYIDVESFARYYLLNELLYNLDGGWASFMMYKDTDSIDPKIYAGPAWDYDKVLDNPSFSANKIIQPNELFVNEKIQKIGIVHSEGLLYCLCQHDDFQQTIKSIYTNSIGPACHQYLESNTIDSLITLLGHEADKDNQTHNIRSSKDYENATTIATDFLIKRVDFFDWFYSSTKDEQIHVTCKTKNSSLHKVRQFYFPIGEAIHVPQIEKLYNHTPIYEMYYAGTDSIVTEGTIFHESQELELRKRPPTKHEVQMRRIKKKLAKFGIKI